MSSGDRAWTDNDAGSKPEAGESQGMLGKRRIAALAAVVALAVMAGALGGALATAALTHVAGDDAASQQQSRARRGCGADRCRHSGAEGRRRTCFQARHEPVQQDQRAPRQGREGASRACRQNRQAQRSRGQAPRRASRRARACRSSDGCGEGCHRLDCAAGNGAQGRSGKAADGRRLGAARCRQWRCPDRGPAVAYTKCMPAIPCRASAGSMPSAARTAAGWS